MSESNSCQICGSNENKYFCPRCHIAYCSVSCYQSEDHRQCSEKFYEQWVHDEMKNRQSDPETKKIMLELLKKNQETNSEESLDSDDEDNESDLAVRIKNVNLNDEEAIWEKLTSTEKEEFKNLVATGGIFQILPEWEPWWKLLKRKNLIQDCWEPLDCKNICPSVPKNVPMLVELTKIKPSPSVAFMLLNVLISYVYTVRWFKGAHRDMPVESITNCIALSATLRNNSIFIDSKEAFAAFENDLSKCKWLRDDISNKFLIQEDLTDIINGSFADDLFYCIKAAICDLNTLCLQAALILKANNTCYLKCFSGHIPRLKLLQQISKKMSYFLSWIGEHGKLLSKIL